MELPAEESWVNHMQGFSLMFENVEMGMGGAVGMILPSSHTNAHKTKTMVESRTLFHAPLSASCETGMYVINVIPICCLAAGNTGCETAEADAPPAKKCII